MEYRFLGWPADGPTLRLDHEAFAYAGKFVVSKTGKAVACEGDAAIPPARDGYAEGVLAAVSFSGDRTDEDAAWLRYVTVRRDRRGAGVGPRLCAFAADRLESRRDRVRIAVNNPYAYHALYKAGFGFVDRETGLAELVLERPPPAGADEERYADGLARYAERDDLSAAERAFVAEKRAAGPPDRIESPG